MKLSHTVRPVFDDRNLVSSAGLLPALRLAESAGFYDLLQTLTVPSPNPGTKAACVVAGMLAGADSIDDLDLLRHGAMKRLFPGVRAPSTLGTYLRSFTFGHTQQLASVNRRLLIGLAGRVNRFLPPTPDPASPSTPGSGATGPGQGLCFVDIDDTIREVHGHHKQGAAVGYTRVRGLNIQLATISSADTAPVIAGARLRRGNIASAKGAGELVTQAMKTVAATSGAPVLIRADSAYFGGPFVATVTGHGGLFSITARANPSIKKGIASIPETAWTPIKYAQAIWDDTEKRWISDAEVAETEVTIFGRSKAAKKITCRLVVRRVKPLRPIASDGTTQGELFAAHRHHAFITNSTLPTIEADRTHRHHAVIEQVIAELKDGPLAHLPSGAYPANAAWLAFATLAFNIARATAIAAGQHKARWATIRTRIINTPARLATTARRLTLHLPTQWPWATHWQQLWKTATSPDPPTTPTT